MLSRVFYAVTPQNTCKSIPDSEVLHSSGLSDVYISVRTTSKYHPLRLSMLMGTWMQKMVPSQVYRLHDKILRS